MCSQANYLSQLSEKEAKEFITSPVNVAKTRTMEDMISSNKRRFQNRRNTLPANVSCFFLIL